MAGRVADRRTRRARLRLQVEHGVDARHARLLPPRAGLPPLPPSPADVLAHVRVQRELHPAALARRGRARQGLAPRKMPGDRWQQFANLRALYAYMWAHPGKKLLFMGGELAQDDEWSHDRSLDWHLLEHKEHSGVHALVRELNARLPRRAGALGARPRSGRVHVARGERREPQRPCVRPVRQRHDAAARLRLQPLARGAPRATASACRRRAAGSSGSTPTRPTTAARTSATSAASRARRGRGTSSRSRPR